MVEGTKYRIKNLEKVHFYKLELAVKSNSSLWCFYIEVFLIALETLKIKCSKMTRIMYRCPKKITLSIHFSPLPTCSWFTLPYVPSIVNQYYKITKKNSCKFFQSQPLYYKLHFIRF